MTNNEKMIKLYGQSDGICKDCTHFDEDKNRCRIGRVKVCRHMTACGKFESNEKGENDA